MRVLWALTILLSAITVAKASDFKRDFEAKSRQMQIEFERKKKEFEKEKKTNSKPNSTASKKSPPSFNPKSAPPPEVCFVKFVVATQKATSMSQILKYLPEDKAEAYKHRQENFNPETARERRKRYEAEGKLDEDSIKHLTSSPYDNGLKFHKRVADKIRSLKSVRIDGDKAWLTVAIRSSAVINGVAYPKGTATVGMVGEGNTWKYDSFKESVMVSR